MGRKTNITLIGMPASGKSSVGVVLAKRLGKRFVDTDIVIQEKYGKLLKELIEEHGDDGFREIEDEVNASLDVTDSIRQCGIRREGHGTSERNQCCDILGTFIYRYKVKTRRFEGKRNHFKRRPDFKRPLP